MARVLRAIKSVASKGPLAEVGFETFQFRRHSNSQEQFQSGISIIALARGFPRIFERYGFRLPSKIGFKMGYEPANRVATNQHV